MFTGIVEEVGQVCNIFYDSGFLNLQISCSKVLKDTKIGDSIMTNGVCLTVKEIGENYFTADVMGETLDKSNLGTLNCKDKVNLERALCLSDRLGGHIVSGHIDGAGKIVNIEKNEDGTWFTIKCSKDISKYVIYKGSIAIDGISLTVAKQENNKFKVSVIPHTLENTVLKYKKINSIVNLECDVVGKYIEKLIKNDEKSVTGKESNITMDFLINNGF